MSLGTAKEVESVSYSNALGIGFTTGPNASIGAKMALCACNLAAKAVEICHDLREDTVGRCAGATLPRVSRLDQVSVVFRRFQPQRSPMAAHCRSTYANSFVTAHG